MKIRTRLMAVIIMAFAMVVCAEAVEISDFSQITDMEGTYELTADVTLPEDFSPIGSESAPFTGTFDGRGFTVTGSYSALFGCTDGAAVKNLNVVNGNLKSDIIFGGIAAIADGKTVIENCTFAGAVSVNSDGMYVLGGGIAGLVGEDAVVTNCGVNVNLSVNDKPYVLSFGGIAGENRGVVSYCFSEGNITASSDKYKVNLGGTVGENRGNIEGCFSRVVISGTVANEASQLFAGGITGFNNEGDIVRAGNLGSVTGEGLSTYPVYIGGIAGINNNGSIEIAKNSAALFATRSFAGGIAGFNLGNGTGAYITEALNSGAIVKYDSVAGGITSASVVTGEENSSASVKYALNLSSDKAVAENGGESADIYNMGEADGVSTAVTSEDMKENGIPALESHDKIWVNNTEISALPDLLITGDDSKAQLIASNKGDGGDVAYYLYSPDASGYAKAFTAVYFNGTRYLGMSYVEKAPTETYARLKADNIPENTTRIKFIAFAEAFGSAFKPAEVISTEVAYTK